MRYNLCKCKCRCKCRVQDKVSKVKEKGFNCQTLSSSKKVLTNKCKKGCKEVSKANNLREKVKKAKKGKARKVSKGKTDKVEVNKVLMAIKDRKARTEKKALKEKKERKAKAPIAKAIPKR